MHGHRRGTLGLLATLILLAAPTSGAAQPPGLGDDALVVSLGSRVSTFFDGVAAGQVRAAFDELLARSQLLKRPEPLANLIKKTSELERSYGPYREHERIEARRVGADLVILKYLYKCENYPVVWHIVFYRDPREARAQEGAKPADAWRVISLRFDTDLEALAR